MASRGTLLRLRQLKQCVEALESDISSARSKIQLCNKTPKIKTTTVPHLHSNVRAFSVLTCKYVSPSEKVGKCCAVDLPLQNAVRNASDDHTQDVNHRTEVTYDELVRLIDAGDLHLFDVREPKEIEQTGLMPGAINIPITKLKSSLAMDEEQFRETYHCQKPKGPGENLLFCGFSNVKSEAALELAHKAGFKKARHYPGGWKEWAEKKQATG